MNQSSSPSQVPKATSRNRGYSLLEMSLAVFAIAVIAAIVFVAFADTQSTANQTRALSEINAIANSARSFRSSFAQGGLYTNLTNAKVLEDNGYTMGGMSLNGNNAVNVYGLPVTIATVTGGTDATLIYTSPTQEDCLALMGFFTDDPGTTPTTTEDAHVSGFKAGAVCSTAGALTLILE